MDNEEALASFRDYLDRNSFLTSAGVRAEIMQIVEAFARAIDPVPLCEATVAEMQVFVRDNRQPARDSVDSLARSIGRQMASLRDHPYKIALLAFRGWRNTVRPHRR